MSSKQFVFLILLTSLLILLINPVALADITNIETPPADAGTLNVGETLTLTFKASYSGSTDSRAVISIGFNSSGWTYAGFTATMDTIDVSAGFTETIMADSIGLTNGALEPDEETLTVSLNFTATAEGAYTFDWSYAFSIISGTSPDVEIAIGTTDATVVSPVECDVTFLTDPVGLGFNITYQGTTYNDSDSDTFAYGTSGPATAGCPDGYVFDHWESTGNVTVVGSTVTITCGGTLKAFFSPVECTVTFLTDPVDVGSIDFEGKTYTNGQSDVFSYGTSGVATANAPVDYVFDHWEVTGNVEVVGSTVTITCGGTLKAFFSPVEVLPPTIESCDSTGVQKDVFDLDETVYVNGSGYAPSTVAVFTYPIYVVEDDTWSDNKPIPARVPGTVTTVSSDALGNIPPTPIWTAPLTPGKYDIVVDVNKNGFYDEGIDALDDNDIEVTAGFFVIPESLIGTIISLVGCFAALAVFRISKRKRL